MKVQRTEVVIINLQLFLLKAAMAKIIRGAIGGSMGSAVVGGLSPPAPPLDLSHGGSGVLVSTTSTTSTTHGWGLLVHGLESELPYLLDLRYRATTAAGTTAS